jgi:hypothetical protein
MRRLIRALTDRIERLRAEARGFKRHIRNRREERERADERREHLDSVIPRLVKRQQRYIEEHASRNPDLQDLIDEHKAEREQLRTRRERITDAIGRFADKAQRRYRRIRWSVVKRTTVRRKLRKARQERKPKPEPWQANGHEWWNLTDRAKQLLAIAVVSYDLACTSITRNWGTGSHHEYVPTRGFDCAGGRMTEFQRDLRYGRVEGFGLGDLLELFGPDNAACADNGAPYVMAEGSANENLHDNHVHAFVYG